MFSRILLGNLETSSETKATFGSHLVEACTFNYPHNGRAQLRLVIGQLAFPVVHYKH